MPNTATAEPPTSRSAVPPHDRSASHTSAAQRSSSSRACSGSPPAGAAVASTSTAVTSLRSSTGGSACGAGAAGPAGSAAGGKRPAAISWCSRRAGLHAQLLGQPLLELPVAAHGEVALPGQRVRPHQAGGGRLVQRVHGGQPLQRPRRASLVAGGLQLGRPLQQQPAEARPELLPVPLGPGLEPVLGQQLPGVQVDRGRQVPGLRRRLERLDVDPQPLRGELQHLLAQPQVLWAQRPWRAKWTALRRLAAAASGGSSGQSASMSCSRCRRCDGASASSFTTAFALFRRQASSGTGSESIPTRKPPSSQIRTSAAIALLPSPR
jgi:hypothetical protein